MKRGTWNAERGAKTTRRGLLACVLALGLAVALGVLGAGLIAATAALRTRMERT